MWQKYSTTTRSACVKSVSSTTTEARSLTGVKTVTKSISAPSLVNPLPWTPVSVVI